MDTDALLSSTAIIKNIEYFTRVGLALDYKFDKKYTHVIYQINHKLLKKRVTDKNLDVISSILALNDLLNLNLDVTNIQDILNEEIKTLDKHDFFTAYSLLKS